MERICERREQVKVGLTNGDGRLAGMLGTHELSRMD